MDVLFMFTEFATSVRDREMLFAHQKPSLIIILSFLKYILFDSNLLAYVNNTKTVSGYSVYALLLLI